MKMVELLPLRGKNSCFLAKIKMVELLPSRGKNENGRAVSFERQK